MAVGRRERQRHGYRGHDVDGDYHRQAGRIQRRSGGRGHGPRRRDPGAQDAHHAGGHSPVVHKHDRSRHLLPIHLRAWPDTAELRKMRHPRRTAMRQDAFRKASALRLHRRLHRSESTGKRMRQSERIPRQSLRRPARQSPWRKGQRPSLRGRSRPQPAG